MMTLTQRPLRSFRVYAIPLAVALFALSGCDYYDHDYGSDPPAATTDEIVHVPLFIEDADGNAPSDPATPLFENRKHNPVLAPDGRPITLAAFNSAAGTAKVRCIDGGTHVRLDLSGLIPNGIYTLWNAVFEAPGFEPTFAHMDRPRRARAARWYPETRSLPPSTGRHRSKRSRRRVRSRCSVRSAVARSPTRSSGTSSGPTTSTVRRTAPTSARTGPP